MKETEKAYLAGFIDGEGTITANFRMTSRSLKEAVHYRIMLPNTNKDILDYLQGKWGGRVYLMAKPRSPRHKQVHYIYWGGKAADPVLEAILPYLHIKKRQAEIALLLSELSLPRGKMRRAGVTPEHHEKRKYLVAEMTKLNHRGVLIEGEV